jgi:hypothetical protein
LLEIINGGAQAAFHSLASGVVVPISDFPKIGKLD